MGNQSEQEPHIVKFSIEQELSPRKFKKVTKKFLKAIMPQVVTTSYFISFIWIAFYLCFVAILSFQAFSTLKDYQSYPVNVEVRIETSAKSLDFPAVTLCNNNIVKKSLISRIPKYKELASLSDIVYNEIIPEHNRDKETLQKLGLHECSGSPSTWIPESWICNGKQDCSDASDEDADRCLQHQRLNYSESCLHGFEKCPGESTCALLCDGVNDCVLAPGYDESEELGCPQSQGVTYLNADTSPQNLSSPNFPNIYTNNLEKVYIINAPTSFFIKIKFFHFHVEECDKRLCWCDFLTVQEHYSKPGTFFSFNGVPKMCGFMCNFTEIETSTNGIKLSFFTDYANSLHGWSLAFWAIPDSERLSPTSHKVFYNSTCGYEQKSESSETEYDMDYYPVNGMDVSNASHFLKKSQIL